MKFMQTFADSVPLKRWGEMSDVANLALYLASQESSHVHGALIRINGSETSAAIPSDHEIVRGSLAAKARGMVRRPETRIGLFWASSRSDWPTGPRSASTAR
jgi:Enoyl-(Acyl carrier protein) reductase